MSEILAVEARLLEFLRTERFSAGRDITAETDLVASGFDSLAMVSLLMFVEKSFGLWIPQNELTGENLQNPHTLAAMVVRLLHNQPPVA